MAFPASTITKEFAWAGLRRAAKKIKSRVQSLRDLSAAGSTGRGAYLQLQRELNDTIDEWASFASTPGLQAYVRDQIEDPALDIAAEYLAMRNAAIAVRDWIFNNIPRDTSSGAALIFTIDQQGNRTELQVSVGGASGFRSSADSFLSTIG